MFNIHECGICCELAIFERRRGWLGSKISGCGQLPEVAVYFAMSGLPPEADIKRKGRHVRWVHSRPTLNPQGRQFCANNGSNQTSIRSHSGQREWPASDEAARAASFKPKYSFDPILAFISQSFCMGRIGFWD
jgi:hypothetical protein